MDEVNEVKEVKEVNNVSNVISEVVWGTVKEEETMAPSIQDVPEEVTLELPVPPSPEQSIFITEKDTFDVTATYYKEGDRLFVMGVDDDFDVSHENYKLTCTFKYPNLGDSQTISSNAGVETTELTAASMNRLEIARLLTLIRKWSSAIMELSNDNFMSLNPRVVKSLVNQVRSVIGIDGLS